jgi:hypothetical protein
MLLLVGVVWQIISLLYRAFDLLALYRSFGTMSIDKFYLLVHVQTNLCANLA